MRYYQVNGVEKNPSREVWRFYWWPRRLLTPDASRGETRWGFQRVVEWERLMLPVSYKGLAGVVPAGVMIKRWVPLSWAT